MDIIRFTYLIAALQTAVPHLGETAVLDRLCGPLCDAITNQTGSQALLEQFEHSNLFLASLDDQRKWYRYHPHVHEPFRGCQ